MKRVLRPIITVPILALLLILQLEHAPLPVVAEAGYSTDPATGTSLNQDTAASGYSPQLFIENEGQFDPRARFQMFGGRNIVWLTSDGLWLTQLETRTNAERSPVGAADSSTTDPQKGINLKLNYIGANPRPELQPFSPLETKISYFIGDDPTSWHPDVPIWRGVRYVDLYPGIDLEITSLGGELVQRVIAVPGTDLSQVRWEIEGADTIETDGEAIHITANDIHMRIPLLRVSAVGETDLDIKIPIPAIQGSQVTAPFASSSFSLLATVQENDPADLIYGTYIGGAFDEESFDIALDGQGNAYITGNTFSPEFPTSPGAFDVENSGLGDAFLVKINPFGTELVYATFLGGVNEDEGHSVGVDTTGNAYVAGSTFSSDFPATPGAFDTTLDGDTDAFVVKLNGSGTDLVYSTFLGGSNGECEPPFRAQCDIVVDGAGNVYLSGETLSTDFPTTQGAFDTLLTGLSDAFAVKLNASGSALLYGTFLGGWAFDSANAIAVDLEGNAYLTGLTWSNDFPTSEGAFDRTMLDGWDAFVAKLNETGTALVYGTFLGGVPEYPFQEQGHGIAVDQFGYAYVTGDTSSPDFPTTPGAWDTSYNGGIDSQMGDAFVTKVNLDGSALVYSTFLGGEDIDQARGIEVDESGNAYILGNTQSESFPLTPGAFISNKGSTVEIYVTRLNSAGSDLQYSTLLAKGMWEKDLVVDDSGRVYGTGMTFWTDFPTTLDAFDTTYNGGDDVFIFKLDTGGVEPPPDGEPDVAVTAVLNEKWYDPQEDRWYFNYAFQARNIGTATAHSVTMFVDLPAEMEYVSSNIPPVNNAQVTGIPDSPASTITFNIGSLLWGGGQSIVNVTGRTTPGLSPGTHIPVTVTTETPGDTKPENDQDTIDGEIPIVQPTLTARALCSNRVDIRVSAQAGATITLYNGNSILTEATAGADGLWSAEITLPDGNYEFSATASFGSQVSIPSLPVPVTVDSSRLFELISVEGPAGVQSSTGNHGNWVFTVQPLVNYTFKVKVCTCEAEKSVTFHFGAIQIPLNELSPGEFSNLFSADGSRVEIESSVTVKCGPVTVTSNGKIRVLIDPDGIVFNVDQGLDSPLEGITVTNWALDSSTNSWIVWPAALFDGQVNPQVTGSDGYFAFFTLPGQYRLNVAGTSSFQPYRSEIITVVDELVHVNVPLTPVYAGDSAYTVELNTAGFSPPTITVPRGATIVWRNLDLVQRRILSDLDPETDTRSWDSGVLNPGEGYFRQFNTLGTYPYQDTLAGQVGTVIVVEAIYLPVILR